MSEEKQLIPEQEPHELGPLDPDNLPEGYYLDKNGCIRHAEKHFLVRGGKSMNPKGRPKTAGLVIQIKKSFGKESEKIVDKLLKIIMYEHDNDLYKGSDGKLKRERFPRVKPADQIAAMKLVLAYRYGQPAQQVNVDEKVDIKIDARMTQVAELISRNRDKLKVITGGRVEEEIIDVEHRDIITDSD